MLSLSFCKAGGFISDLPNLPNLGDEEDLSKPPSEKDVEFKTFTSHSENRLSPLVSFLSEQKSI